MSVLWKNKQMLGWAIAYKSFNYAAPYHRKPKIQHPKSRVVETLEYAPGLTYFEERGQLACSNLPAACKFLISLCHCHSEHPDYFKYVIHNFYSLDFHRISGFPAFHNLGLVCILFFRSELREQGIKGVDSKLLEELTDDNIDEQLITEEIEKLSEEYDLRAIKSVYLYTTLVGCSHWHVITCQENYYQWMCSI